MKAVVTRWLSHVAACKRCRERYHIIIEALGILSTTYNPELVTYRNTLLDTETVYQILKNIGENIDTNHLKNFNNANKIIEKIEVYERQNIVFQYVQIPKARP